MFVRVHTVLADDTKELNRNDLYVKVWSAPLATVAQILDVTDEVMRQACGILNVPLPKRGHWRRSKLPRTKALPPLRRGDAEKLMLFWRRGRWRLVSVPPHPNPIGRPKGQAQEPLHRLVRRAQEHFEYPTLGKHGVMRAKNGSGPSLRVTPLLRERALELADKLFKRLEADGFAIDWKGNVRVATTDGPVKVAIFEKIELVEEDGSDQSGYGSRYRSFSFKAVGKLCVSIINPEGATFKEWSDEPERPVVELIEEMCLAIGRFPNDWAEELNGREARRLEWEERERREQEKRRLKRLEEEKIQRLEVELTAWSKATLIRSYADAFESAHRATPTDRLPEEVEEWLAWTRRRADMVDPTIIT